MSVVTGSIIIDADPEAVLAILLDLSDYPSWQPGVERVDIEDTDERGRPRQATWHAKAMGLRATHSLRYEYPADGCFEYHLVGSEVMTRFDFSCTVTGDGGGKSEVSVSQELGIKWAMPEAILNKNARKGIGKMLDALKRKAEQDRPR
ncbi:SRPBCC family protein [Microbispora triticiradicis]|uniref:SRPBCC family protein n=1 Tax=Microbispora triticiradicis TaxID=2200763 RepID=UPI001AD6F853|nr:SRPBCC family protein [Microbispora triticiradicis]MBO4270729.1 hypothetical protein [Microbispora triticiradicis]